MNRLLNIAFSVAVTVVIAAPALAGTAPRVPAPVAGLGIGAVALIGMGYRALKGRSGK